MTSRTQSLPPEYVAMLDRDGHKNPPAFAHALSHMFRGVDLRDKRVLEIGSGRGLLAIYMGMQGAKQVVSMEPEMVGATSGVIADQRARIAALGLRNVEVVAADFNTWNAGDQRFDVIVSRASINHLYESDRHADHDSETRGRYLDVARKIHGLLAPGGQFVATDACRYAFFTAARDLGIKRPWRRARTGINWRYHQNPGTWRRIFREAGFQRVDVNYPVPYPLRSLALVVDTSLANFFLNGSFVMRAHR